METQTDCKTEEGITVGLIDSLISISRILAKRDLSGQETQEALKDFDEDSDVKIVLLAGQKSRTVKNNNKKAR